MKIIEATDDAIREAADDLIQGDLVIMPTETVYGLAADALNPNAVSKVFEAKGRPGDNPLIVHIASIEALDSIAFTTELSLVLARAFWPGPITLVLKKRPVVPDITTANLDSVAVRIPAHPIALKLITAAQRPIAAPSANNFTELSPSRAEDVNSALAAHATMILQGGPCEVGIESTVVDCRFQSPRILRPGRISRSQIEEATHSSSIEYGDDGNRSPGRYPRHYSPKSKVVLVHKLDANQIGITLDEPQSPHQIQLSSVATEYASELYRTLHDLDLLHQDSIYVQTPPDTAEWEAVWDRLRKASG